MCGKTFLYKFAYVVFEDREKGCFFRENAPECFICISECETFKHPIFSCPLLQSLKNI